MLTDGFKDRRQRLHDILLAILSQQDDLELMDLDNPSAFASEVYRYSSSDSARLLERNQRVLKHYQALVRTAVTLDALLDAEDGIFQDSV